MTYALCHISKAASGIFLGIIIAACQDSKPGESAKDPADKAPAQQTINNQEQNSIQPAAEGNSEILDVSFKGSRGDKIPAQLYLPAGANARARPAIFLQYGLGASKGTGLVVQVANAFMKHGYPTLVMDVPGRGERIAPGGKIDNISNVLDHDLFRWFVADYKVALDYMKTRPEIDAKRIAYVGASWGAITGFPFVARAKEIKVFVSVVGGGGFFGVVPEELDPVNNIAKIEPRPLLLINARNDEIILQPFSEALHAKAGKNATKVWLDTNHTLSTIDIDDFSSRVLKYLDQKLK